MKKKIKLNKWQRAFIKRHNDDETIEARRRKAAGFDKKLEDNANKVLNDSIRRYLRTAGSWNDILGAGMHSIIEARNHAVDMARNHLHLYEKMTEQTAFAGVYMTAIQELIKTKTTPGEEKFKEEALEISLKDFRAALDRVCEIENGVQKPTETKPDTNDLTSIVAAVSAVFHCDKRWEQLYERYQAEVSGFPGLWQLCADLGTAVREAEIAGEIDFDDTPYIEFIDVFVDLLYKQALSKNGDLPDDYTKLIKAAKIKAEKVYG